MNDPSAHNFNLVLKAVRNMHEDLERVNSHVSEVSSQVGIVSRDLASNRAELLELRTLFEEFVGEAQRKANVQQSETRLGTIKADLEREFGHYKVVRRSSIGTLQAFDIGNVSNAAVQAVSEQLMINTPRYWLAPALVALAAWSRDDQELCERSVDAAFSRNPQKTSLSSPSSCADKSGWPRHHGGYVTT